MPVRKLPDDITTLQQMLVARDETIARLLAEIARLKRWQYGSSSERLADLMGQLQLALTDLPVPRQSLRSFLPRMRQRVLLQQTPHP